MKNINRNILLAALLGILFGLFLKFYPEWSFYNNFLGFNELAGQLFIKSLKMILVPLVFFFQLWSVSQILVIIKNLARFGNTPSFIFSVPWP